MKFVIISEPYSSEVVKITLEKKLKNTEFIMINFTIPLSLSIIKKNSSNKRTMISHPGVGLRPSFINLSPQNKDSLETPPSSSLRTNPIETNNITSLEENYSKNKDIKLMVRLKKWKNKMLKTLLSRNLKELTDFHYKLLDEDKNESFEQSAMFME